LSRRWQDQAGDVPATQAIESQEHTVREEGTGTCSGGSGKRVKREKASEYDATNDFAARDVLRHRAAEDLKDDDAASRPILAPLQKARRSLQPGFCHARLAIIRRTIL
jgi:hypothetical protein